jgi:hypothetical protein
VHVGRDRDRHYDRDYRRGHRSYAYEREYRTTRGCCTVTIERDDGSVKRIRKCGY